MSLDQHPEFPVGWDTSKVIPGELLVPDDLSGEDIAPGIVATYEPRPAVLARTGSAAMVVASVTGRACGLSARWFFTGVRAVGFLGWRYVRAHDYQETIGGMSKSSDWSKTDIVRRKRWRLLGWTAGAVAGLNLAGWWALVKFGGMTALDWSWKIPPSLTAAAAVAAITWYGRYRANAPGIAPMQAIAEQDHPDGEEPYPLAWVQSGGQAADCLGRALYAEGADYRDIQTLNRHAWGWELEVVLKGSTPGGVQAKADQLESQMGLPDGGFMIEPDPRDKSRIIVRLVQSNPFADMPRPAVHAPRSLSVHDTVAMGRAMDGSVFELTLDGFCALIIGAMGAGKTLGALRTINEALTACRDAVVWDLDPIKGGLAEFGDLMARRARTPEECEKALEEALSYVTARGQLLPTLGMGDRWHATEKHPNLYINIDEFIQLSPRGKELAIKILRTGRQYGIYLLMAGQEATADALGDAIAMIVAYRILMACRFEDIKIAFGPGAGAQGWRADRMKPAVGPVANDAGQAMIMGGLFNRAIRYQFNSYTRDQISAVVPDRLTAGANRMDSDTVLKAGATLTTTGQRDNLAERLDAVAHTDAPLIAALLRAFHAKARTFLPTSEVLLPVLEAAGVEGVDATALSNRLRKHAPGAKSDRTDCPEGTYLRGWRREDVERAAAGLLDPAQTRQGPGMKAA
jgi:S-DNA-T family DNA segregation ATPase FtsK/SpoIIIE